MKVPSDQADRDLVATGGLTRTLFVEAGAGTGKTTQLVKRITSLVLDQGVPLGKIAAITFTEAAAAELQSRIRVQFEMQAGSSDDDAGPEVRERNAAALADLDMAAISTLHGFASRMLGEFAVSVGLPPRVQVLDEVASQLAHEDRWERFVDALYDDPGNEQLLVRASLVGVALEQRYQGHATLKDVAVELNQNWDRLGLLCATPLESLPDIDTAVFDQAVDRISELPAQCSDPNDLFFVHLTATLLPSMQAIRAITDPERKLRALADTPSWGRGKGGKAGAWGIEVKAAKAQIDDVNAAVDVLRSNVGDCVLRQMLVKISREVVAGAEARRADGGLEFHDLLVLARELLRTSDEARRVLHARYTHILLDEFQDTDPIQIELAALIAATVASDAGDSAGGDRPRTWDELDVDEGRLFFVGDPKQSIYRFRRADIELFLAARDRFGGSGSLLRLTTNFRTVAHILEWVNDLFTSAMPEELPGKQPLYQPLQPWRTVEEGADHRPVLLGGPHPDPKVKAGPLREAEAASVAAVITDISTNGAKWRVFDEKEERWRDGRRSDVTILVPTRTSLPYLRQALVDAEIPYRLATGTLVYDTQEVRDALAAIRAVDDPTDTLSLVAALRSPLFVCSDVDLFTYANAGGRWDIRRDPPDSVPQDHFVRLAVARLRTLWLERWWLTPSALLERLLRESEAFLLAFGDPRPAEVWRRLRFLVDQARSFEESGGGDLRGFVAWAALQSADSARVHEPLLPETDDEAVQILTIHGAKGLEFPITILSGMTTQAGNNRSGVSVLWAADGTPEVKIRKGLATANHEPRADLEQEMDSHEKLRLLYVATTRARDHLIVSCHHQSESSGTYATRFWQHFSGESALCRPAPAPAATSDEPIAVANGEPSTTAPAAKALVPIDDRAEWIAAREAALAPYRSPRVRSATAVARMVQAAPPDQSDLLDEDDDNADEGDDSGGFRRRKGRAGSAIGQAVHATLEVIDLADPQQLSEQVLRQCEAQSIPELTDTALSLVRSALASPTVQWAATRVHHKELYVAAPFGGRIIEGYVDLLVEGPDGLVVVDYKTDSARTEAEIDAKLATYELQGAAYALALEEATGIPVVDCRFVFCRAGEAVERSVLDLPAAKQRVRASVAL